MPGAALESHCEATALRVVLTATSGDPQEQGRHSLTELTEYREPQKLKEQKQKQQQQKPKIQGAWRRGEIREEHPRVRHTVGQ